MEGKPDRVWGCLLSSAFSASWIRFETDALRHIHHRENRMKRKPIKSSGPLIVPASKPRNPLVASALMRKAGEHRKSNKALRAQEKRESQRGARLAAGHQAFTLTYDGFDSLAPHHPNHSLCA